MTAPSESSHRLAWRVAEPLHAMIYFAPEARAAYSELGLGPRDGYFASRAAAFGPVGPGPVIASFYNFSPRLVTRALPRAWERTTPAAILTARQEAARAALRRGLGDDAEVAEAAVLARRAAESAEPHAAGRPLYAAHADLPWPSDPLLQLFHAQTLLREFRGDGHVAALLTAGIPGVEALVLHTASGDRLPADLQKSRGWTDDEWAAAIDRLRSRGLLAAPSLALTPAGAALRAEVEATTDRLAAPAYEVLGEDGRLRLAALTRPLSRTLVTAGFLDPGI